MRLFKISEIYRDNNKLEVGVVVYSSNPITPQLPFLYQANLLDEVYSIFSISKSEYTLSKETAISIKADVRGYFISYILEFTSVFSYDSIGPVKGYDGKSGVRGTTGASGSEGSTGEVGYLGYSGTDGHTGATGFGGPAGYEGSAGLIGDDGVIGHTGSTGSLGSQGSIGVLGSTGIVGATGLKGIPGPAGYTGPRGSAGNDGTDGDIGVAGNIGPTGSAGVTGSFGDSGPGGFEGDIGSKGVTGIQGPRGITGDSGDSGPLGNTGTSGTRGTSGSEGPTGIIGTVGPQGRIGAVGYRGVTGNIGITGSQGITGPDGHSGSVGPIGSSGEVGFQGSIGFNGTTGPIGASGEPGVSPTGIQGSSGSVGSIGSRGFTGSFGSTGLIGAGGNTGTVGNFGPIGFIGPTGDLGITGIDGVTGVTGTQGSIGSRGPIGATGSQGATGIRGPIGSTGFVGPKGPDGTTGVIGADGLIGIDGPVGSVGNAGYEGTVGEPGFAGLDGAFGSQGQRGPTGIQGPTGVEGEIFLSGAQGPTGSTGEYGSTGPFGDTGFNGTTGLGGPIGITGKAGPDGAIGKTGAVGLVGATGPKGSQGAQGPGGTGATGPQGFPGRRGNPGIVGSTGLVGPTGSQPQGVTGSIGVLGLRGSTGPDGYTGSTGSRGHTGVTGYTGPQGITGSIGPFGSNFNSFTGTSVWYVDTISGSDSNSGTVLSPFASVEKLYDILNGYIYRDTEVIILNSSVEKPASLILNWRFTSNTSKSSPLLTYKSGTWTPLFSSNILTSTPPDPSTKTPYKITQSASYGDAYFADDASNYTFEVRTNLGISYTTSFRALTFRNAKASKTDTSGNWAIPTGSTNFYGPSSLQKGKLVGNNDSNESILVKGFYVYGSYSPESSNSQSLVNSTLAIENSVIVSNFYVENCRVVFNACKLASTFVNNSIISVNHSTVSSTLNIKNSKSVGLNDVYLMGGLEVRNSTLNVTSLQFSSNNQLTNSTVNLNTSTYISSVGSPVTTYSFGVGSWRLNAKSQIVSPSYLDTFDSKIFLGNSTNSSSLPNLYRFGGTTLPVSISPLYLSNLQFPPMNGNLLDPKTGSRVSTPSDPSVLRFYDPGLGSYNGTFNLQDISGKLRLLPSSPTDTAYMPFPGFTYDATNGSITTTTSQISSRGNCGVEPTYPFSAFVVAKTTGLTGTNQYVTSTEYELSGTKAGFTLGFQNDLRPFVSNRYGSQVYTFDPITLNSWIMFGYTLNGSSGIAKFYKNGSYITQRSGWPYTFTIDKALYIGYSDHAVWGKRFRFNGGIGCIIFYNKVLNDNEVYSLYLRYKNRFGI